MRTRNLYAINPRQVEGIKIGMDLCVLKLRQLKMGHVADGIVAGVNKIFTPVDVTDHTIEQVAIAIAAEDEQGWGVLSSDIREDYREIARAAVETFVIEAKK